MTWLSIQKVKKSKDEIKHSIYKNTKKNETEQKQNYKIPQKEMKGLEGKIACMHWVSMALKRTAFFRFVHTLHMIPMQSATGKDGPKFLESWNSPNSLECINTRSACTSNPACCYHKRMTVTDAHHYNRVQKQAHTFIVCFWQFTGGKVFFTNSTQTTEYPYAKDRVLNIYKN